LIKVLNKNQRGFTLIEVLVAMAILGLVGVAFLVSLSIASKAIILADERTTSESLARSQIEYIKNQSYSDDSWTYTVTSSQRSPTQQPSWWDPDNDIPPLLSSNYDGYSVEASAVDFDADGDGTVEVPGEDEDIRKITVTVSHHGEEVLTLEDYKVDR